MLSKLRFARLRNVHIFEQLRLEELLLRHDDSDSCWCLINSGPPAPTIITGLSGKVPELVDIDAAKRDNISVIRRFTGGGTVVVDENTFFVSFIGNVSSKEVKGLI
jgi:lipoate-protein ligase A